MDRQRQRNSTWLDRTSGGTSRGWRATKPGARSHRALGQCQTLVCPRTRLAIRASPSRHLPTSSARSCATAGTANANWSWRAGACRDHCSLAASRSPRSATSRARTGGAGFRRGAAVLSRRPASAGTKRHEAPQDPDMVRAERGPAAVRLCGPMDEGGTEYAGQRARRSKASMSYSGF